MNKMIFNPVGSTFEEGGVLLKVVEISDCRTCEGCWYAHKDKDTGLKNYNGSCYLHRHACTSGNRRDGKQVVFTEVIDTSKL